MVQTYQIKIACLLRILINRAPNSSVGPHCSLYFEIYATLTVNVCSNEDSLQQREAQQKSGFPRLIFALL